jgi:hypothetical protein
LGAWVKYQKTAEDQWNEHVENPAPVRETSGQGTETPPDTATDSRSDVDTEDGPGSDHRELDLPDFERGHEPEVLALDQSRNGE